MANESIMKQTIGDLALTLQEGFKRILPVQRKYNFSVIVTGHVRAEMDQVEIMRGNKVKMGASFGVQHYGEYFMAVSRLMNKDSKVDELGNALVNENRKDMNDNEELTGHKIRVVMKGNSAHGSAVGRTAEFTFDYAKGICSQHEEVFNLGVNQGVIDKPSNVKYAFGDKSWHGKPAMLEAIKNDNHLYNEILKKIKDLDMGYAKQENVVKPKEE
jgi:hypothetical protein